MQFLRMYIESESLFFLFLTTAWWDLRADQSARSAAKGSCCLFPAKYALAQNKGAINRQINITFMTQLCYNNTAFAFLWGRASSSLKTMASLLVLCAVKNSPTFPVKIMQTISARLTLSYFWCCFSAHHLKLSSQFASYKMFAVVFFFINCL